MPKTKDTAVLDEMIGEITVDAYGDHEILQAFRQAIEDEVRFPCDGSVVGETVSVLRIDYDGNERRGLTATCRGKDGSSHAVSAADIVFPKQSNGYRYIACYRKWLGLDPFSEGSKPSRQKKEIALNGNEPHELIVLSVSQLSVRCSTLSRDLDVTLKAGYAGNIVPGDIVTVIPAKMWRYAGHSYLSGKIGSKRLDIPALGLKPLALHHFGPWNPEDHYWGEPDEPLEKWEQALIACGVRQSYEMEQVLPGMAPDNYDSDPVGDAVDLHHGGDYDGARKILMELCRQDLRCLDAHAHLGNLCFDYAPEKALRHYEIGLLIGELSLGADFDGLLEWGLIDNRPFLRCMHGYGLCLWRLGRYEEAGRIFEKMLRLNPSDNQGVRFVLDHVKNQRVWEKD